jgi:hypothetical protein
MVITENNGLLVSVKVDQVTPAFTALPTFIISASGLSFASRLDSS